VKRTFVVGIALVALLALGGTAHATHVQCGDTITETTVLDSDIVCTGSDVHSAAVTIGASNVTLWMASHTITQTGPGTDTGIQVGGPPSDSVSNVEIRRGTISGFPRGIWMLASDSSILKVHAIAQSYGFEIFGPRNYVYGSSIERTGDFPSGSIGINFDDYSGCGCVSTDASTYGNTISGMDTGIDSVSGDRPRHVLDYVHDCAPTSSGGIGIRVANYSTNAVVNRNKVQRCGPGPGIYVWDTINFDGAGALVRLNLLLDNTGNGLYVSDATAIIGRNMANRNLSGSGIVSSQAGTRIQNNTANDNGGYGIDGVTGTVDGGGNSAAGNGDGTPAQQCRNVSC
jgi:hypothetical protein